MVTFRAVLSMGLIAVIVLLLYLHFTPSPKARPSPNVEEVTHIGGKEEATHKEIEINEIEINDISVDKIYEENVVTVKFGDLLITYDADDWEALPTDRWLKRWVKVKNEGKQPITIYFEFQERVREKNGAFRWVPSGSWFPQPWVLDLDPGEEQTLWHFIDFTPFSWEGEKPKNTSFEFRALIRNETTEEEKYVYFTDKFVHDFKMVDNSLLKVKVVNENNEPLSNVEIVVSSVYISSGGGDPEYKRTYFTDSECVAKIPLFAHRYRDSKALHGYSLLFRKKGYYEKYSVVFPEPGKMREITVKMMPKKEELHFKLVKCHDTGYSVWYVRVKNDCVVFAHGHYKTEGEKVYDKNHGIYFFDREGNLKWHIHTQHAVWGIDVSDDCSLVFAMELRGEGGYMLDKNGRVLWKTSEEKNMLHNVESREVKISHNKKYVAVGAGDGWLYLADADTGKLAWQTNLRGQIRQIVFTQDDSIIYASSGDGYIYKVRAKDGKILGRAYVEAWLYRNSLTLSKDEKHAFTISKIGRACLVDLEKMQTIWCFDTRGGGHGTDATSDFRYLALASGGSYGMMLFLLDGTPLWYISSPSWHVQVVNEKYVIYAGGEVFDFAGNVIYKMEEEFPEDVLGEEFVYMSDDLNEIITMRNGKICFFRRVP